MFGICCVNWVNVVEGNRRHVRHTSKDSGLGKSRGFHIERHHCLPQRCRSAVFITSDRVCILGPELEKGLTYCVQRSLLL